MKIVTTFVCLVLMSAAASADPNADAKAHSEAFAKAMKSRDIAAVMALYADDAYVIWPGQGEEAHGKAAIQKLVTDFLATPQGPAPVLKSQQVVDLGGGVLAVIGQWDSVATAPNGASQTIPVRTTEILKKIGNKTVYLVDHASVGLAPPATP
jgi:uncharacterized protein (TIGR02246 family)